MERRKYIKSIGAGSIISLSGCLGILDNEKNIDDDSDEVIESKNFSRDRITEPQYEINIPITEKEQWNSDYLGNNMPINNISNFKELEFSKIKEPKLSMTSSDRPREFYAETYKDKSEWSKNIELGTEENISEDNLLLQVESGYSKLGASHVWRRIEEFSNGYALYGYYRTPFRRISNPETKRSVVSIETNKTDPEVFVNLTVTPEHQIVFSSEEDVVGIQRLS